MALQGLLDALHQRVGNEIRALLERAGQEAAALLDAADRNAVARRDAALREREHALRDSAERAAVAARREARRLELEARDRLLARVLAAAHQRIAAAGATPAFAAAAAARLAAALDRFGDQPVMVRCAASLARTLRPVIAGREGVSLVPDAAIAAGFRVESCDGITAIDATLEGQLARDRAPASLAAVAALERTA